ncbi:MAG: alpha/beta fold hydrolase [Pseudohongiellaceae bacterium]
MSLLPTVEIDAPPQTPVNASIIWLHGLGADGHDFAAIVPQLTLSKDYGIHFVFPHAPSIPVTINNGYVMPAWYDILGLDADRHLDDVQLIASADAVHRLIDREIERGIDSRRIVLAGFSQGGAVVYHAALTCAEPLGGVLALSTYFATAGRIEINPANRDLPILACHGMGDPVIQENLGRQSVDTLRSLGFAPEYKTYPMEHAVSSLEIADISAWLQQVLR